jgi:hypothetical protein
MRNLLSTSHVQHNGEANVNKNAHETRGFYARLTMLRLTIIVGGSYCCDRETGCDESALHSNMAYTALTLLEFEAIVGGGALSRRVRIINKDNNLKYLNQIVTYIYK